METIHQARLVNGQPVETEGRFLETEGGLQETEGRFQVHENKLIISPVRREDKDVVVTCKVEETMGQTTLAKMTVPVLCKSLFSTFMHNLIFHHAAKKITTRLVYMYVRRIFCTVRIKNQTCAYHVRSKNRRYANSFRFYAYSDKMKAQSLYVKRT